MKFLNFNKNTEIPDVMKTLIMRRIITGVVLAVAGLISLFFIEYQYSLVVIIIGFGLLAMGGFLYLSCKTNQYLTFSGECSNLDSNVLGTTKFIYISDGTKVIRIVPNAGLSKIGVGDTVCVYIPSNIIVSQENGIVVVPSYYAVEILAKGQGAPDDIKTQNKNKWFFRK